MAWCDVVEPRTLRACRIELGQSQAAGGSAGCFLVGATGKRNVRRRTNGDVPRGVRARGEAMQIHLDRGGRRADRCYPSRGDWRRQNVLSPGATRSTCRLTRGEPLARTVSSRVARRRHADAAVSAAGRLSVSPGLQPTAPAITNAEAGLRPVWPARSTPLHPATASVERALAPACHGRACRRAAVDGGPQWSVRRD